MSARVTSVPELVNASSNPSVHEIILTSGTFVLEHTLTLSRGITIRTEEIGGVALSGGHAVRVLTIDVASGQSAVVLEGLNITNGHVGSMSAEYFYGGGIYVKRGTLIMNRCNVFNNCACGLKFNYGGAFYLEGGTITLTSCSVVNNRAGGGDAGGVLGGGFYVNGGNLTIVDSTIVGNEAWSPDYNWDANGGAFFVAAGAVSLHRCLLQANVASADGGAIMVAGTASLSIYDSQIVGNYGNPAAAVIDSASVIMSSVHFSSNRCAATCSTRTDISFHSSGVSSITDVTTDAVVLVSSPITWNCERGLYMPPVFTVPNMSGCLYRAPPSQPPIPPVRPPPYPPPPRSPPSPPLPSPPPLSPPSPPPIPPDVHLHPPYIYMRVPTAIVIGGNAVQDGDTIAFTRSEQCAGAFTSSLGTEGGIVAQGAVSAVQMNHAGTYFMCLCDDTPASDADFTRSTGVTLMVFDAPPPLASAPSVPASTPLPTFHAPPSIAAAPGKSPTAHANALVVPSAIALPLLTMLAAAARVVWIRRRRWQLRNLGLLHEHGVEMNTTVQHLISDSDKRSLVAEAQRHGTPKLPNHPPGSAGEGSNAGADLRFTLEPADLVTGQPRDAARGVNFYLKADDADVHERMIHGVTSIRREICDHGSDEDRECLDYILNHAAGSSEVVFPNGVRDRGRRGELLSDFASHPFSVQSGLTEAHVLALRLYTSAAYKSINEPLRDRNRSAPHPFPVTVNLIAEGLKRLRSMGAEAEDAHTVRYLWRGMRNLRVTDTFSTDGGTEIAPMSATTDLRIAMRYALSSHSLLFKIVTHSFMERGVDLSYLSCFPEESEHLFAPLTYLRPTGNQQTIEVEGASVTVVEVIPTFGT